MNETLEISGGKSAKLYGFRLEHNDIMDDMRATPDASYKEYPKAMSKLQKLYPKAEGIFVCGNGKDTIVRIKNDGLFVSLTIQDSFLGKENNVGLEAIKKFYEEARKRILATQVSLAKLSTAIQTA